MRSSSERNDTWSGQPKSHGLPLSSQVAILGIDGSGKSTVSCHVAEQLSHSRISCLISDRKFLYHQGEILEAPTPLGEKIRPGFNFMAKHAGSLKWYKYPKLVDLFLRDQCSRFHQENLSGGIIVMDGSPLLNMIAWASIYKKSLLPVDICSRAIGILTGEITLDLNKDSILDTLPELELICRLGLNRMVLPDLCLFLDVDVETACSRISSRGEHLQVHETRDKLSRLREAYLRVCQAAEEHWKVNMYRIDASQSLEEVLQASIGTMN